MSQVLYQCTNNLNFIPVSPKDSSMTTPKKRQRSLDFYIDLTTPKSVPKSPKPRKLSNAFIAEIVISDSEDESIPKRLKDGDTIQSTPKAKSKSTSSLYKNNPITPTSESLQRRHKSNSSLSPNFKNGKFPNNVIHSTPLSHTKLPNSSPGDYMQTMTPIRQNTNHSDCFSNHFISSEAKSGDVILPTNVTTVELFASDTNLSRKNPFFSRINLSNENSGSLLPDIEFLPPPQAPMKSSISSQLADQLNTFAIASHVSIQEILSSESDKYHTPNSSSYSDQVFATPAVTPSPPNTPLISLNILENNQKLYSTPAYTKRSPTRTTEIQETELPQEWIDDAINLPLEGQTNFVKVSSLQFVRSCITTSRVKLTTPLLFPLVNYLVTSQDVNMITQTATLLCDVIKTHPSNTTDNTQCYREVFTWDILINSIQTLCNPSYVEATHDSVLNLYCEVIESELVYPQSSNNNFTQALFWEKCSYSLSDRFRDFIVHFCGLFSTQSPLIPVLLRMVELVLESARKANDFSWLEAAALEFHLQFSKVPSCSYHQILYCINPPWFAGYMAQIRLREIGVTSSKHKPISSKLKDFFTNYTDLLPAHSGFQYTTGSCFNQLQKQLIKYSQIGDCEGIKQLIRQGCDPNVIDENKSWNPLLKACWYGKYSSIEALAEASFETNKKLNIVQNKNGVTPLHLAAKYGNKNVCACLLRIGGPSLLFHLDKKGKFPSEVATEKQVIKLLMNFNEDKIEKILSNIVFNSQIRVPIEVPIIQEFESMVCIALRGIFVSEDINQDDVIACQQAQLFVEKLTSQINKTQSIQLERLQTLISSYF